MIVDELVALLGFKMTGEDNLRKFNAGIDDAGAKLSRFASIAGAAAAIAGAAVAGGLATLGKSVIETGSTFEKLGVQLEALEGSQEKAKKALEWIQDFAKSTPLELEGVINGYAQLRTFGLDPTNGSFQALVDTMAMSGKGQEQLQGIILAVGQAWTKQKLQGDDAMQLLERGVPVWDLLAEKLGKTSAQVQELSSKGKLGRKEIQLLIDAMGERAKGASEKLSKTLEGITSNIGDVWTSFKKRIADSGFYESVKQQLQRVLDTVNRWSDDGTMDRAAKTLSNIFTSASNGIGFAIGRIVEHVAFLNRNFSKIEPYIKPIATAFGVLIAWAFPLASAFAVAALVIDDFLTYLEGGKSVIGDFIESISKFTGIDSGIIAKILGAIAVGGVGLAVAIGPINAATGAITSLAGALKLLGAVKALGFGYMLYQGANEFINPSENSKKYGAGLGPDDLVRWLMSKTSDTGSPAAQDQQSKIDAANSNVFQAFEDRINNANGNMSRMSGSSSTAAVNNTLNDASDKSVTVTVNQTVTQATNAPGAAAQATSRAVAGAASTGLPPTRIVGNTGAF